MTFDAHKPRTVPFVRDCITDEDIQGLEIDIPSCVIDEVPTPKRLIPAGRPTMPITTPPPPLCLQPCPAPFSYEVVGPLTVRMRMDELLDPTSYEPWNTFSTTPTKSQPGNVVSTYTFTVAPNAVTFVYLVYDTTVGTPVPQTTLDTSRGMFHRGPKFPPTVTESGTLTIVPRYPAPDYSLLLLHRIDTRGSSTLDQILRCPPGIQNPPYATTLSVPPKAAKHPFQLFATLPGCLIAIWPGSVMDANGTTWQPTLDDDSLTAVPPYATQPMGLDSAGSKSFWLKVKYTTDAEVEAVQSVSIVLGEYDENYTSNYSELYVLIGKVVHGGVDATTGKCIMTPWNSLRSSIAISKCDTRHTVIPLG